MGDNAALRGAAHALIPAIARPQEVGVDERVALPWTRVSISLPTPVTRVLSKQVSTRRVLMRLLVAAGNETAAWKLADPIVQALEGARPQAPGWRCTPIELINREPQPYEDRDLKVISLNAYPICIPLDFDFYATSTEETP